MATLHVLVIVPLLEERDYFHEKLSGRSGWQVPLTKRGTMRYDFKEGDREAVVRVRTIEKMGHLEAVLALNAAVVTFKPELVILVGLAGSMVPDEIGLGDVVVSNQVKTYSANKVGTISSDASQKPNYRFFRIPPAESANGCIVVDERDRRQEYSYLRYERDFVESVYVDAALSTIERRVTNRELLPISLDNVPANLRPYASMQRDRKVHFGWLFGSHYVVDSKEYRDYVLEKDGDQTFDVYKQLNEPEKLKWKKGKLLAVDMESYGVLKAVEALQVMPSVEGGSKSLVGGIVVRGVSDVAEAKAATDRGSKNEIRKIAVSNAAEIAAQIIERMDYKELFPR